MKHAPLQFYLFIGILVSAQLIAQESVLSWPLPTNTHQINGGSHVWHYTNPYATDPNCNSNGTGKANPKYCGYHAGEDWNRGNGDDDCGDPIKSPFDGDVVFSGPFGSSQVVVVKHTLPDKTTSYMTYHHCKAGTLHPSGSTIKKNDVICQVGNTGTLSCHMHWELNWYDTEPPVLKNPWFGGTRCIDINFDENGVCAGGEIGREEHAFVNGIANYGTPSLLLDDWGNDVMRIQLSESSEFEVDGYVPGSLIFVQQSHCQDPPGSQQTLREAYDSRLIDTIEYLHLEKGWTKWTVNNNAFLAKGVNYRVALSDDVTSNWCLIIPIPGHNQRRARARMEMIQWAASHGCSDDKKTGCIERVETRSMAQIFAPEPWNVWVMGVEVITTSGDRGAGLLAYAFHQENPLLRCIQGVDPASGESHSLWSPIAPGKVYATPSQVLELTLQSFSDTDNCNQQIPFTTTAEEAGR